MNWRSMAFAVASEVGPREMLMVAGIASLAAGLWMAWRPLAPIAVGVALIVLAAVPWRRA